MHQRLDVADLRMLSLTSFFFFNDTATTEIYTLSLHDALPIPGLVWCRRRKICNRRASSLVSPPTDRKSTRLNPSHYSISYAVFFLKKKKSKHGSTRSQGGAKCTRMPQSSSRHA